MKQIAAARGPSRVAMTVIVIALSCTGTPSPEPAPPPASQDIAASQLTAEPRCSDTNPGESTAILSWVLPIGPRARLPEMRVELSPFREQAARNEFSAVWRSQQDTLLTRSVVDSVSRVSVRLGNLDAGVNYYWRVVVGTGQRSEPSAVARVEAPICPVDARPDTLPPGGQDDGERGLRLSWLDRTFRSPDGSIGG